MCFFPFSFWLNSSFVWRVTSVMNWKRRSFTIDIYLFMFLLICKFFSYKFLLPPFLIFKKVYTFTRTQKIVQNYPNHIHILCLRARTTYKIYISHKIIINILWKPRPSLFPTFTLYFYSNGTLQTYISGLTSCKDKYLKWQVQMS